LDKQLQNIKILVLDVDGVLTDGGLIYPEQGQPGMRFHIQDGLGIVVARQAGLEVAIISGRASAALTLRASQLGIVELVQGVTNKAHALQEMAARRGWNLTEVAYMGDDLNDLPAMVLAGAAIAPANAVAEVKATAQLVTTVAGGSGAVREAIETILRAQGRWEEAVKEYLAALEQKQ
jgi:3-deoxy-D-manno-octulosonate 8-phosphate phosphatase (KDO 8-P phosphatase)